MAAKKRIILCNKIDVRDAAYRAAEIAAQYKDMITVPLSVHTREGLDRVKKELIRLAYGEIFQAVQDKKSDFLASRASVDDEEVQYPGSEQ